MIASLRGLAQAPEAIVLKVLQPLLQRAYLNADLLILIAARHMRLFADIERAKVFLEHCALHDDALFQGLFADMVQVPQCRIYLLQAMQSDSLSQLCKTKIATLQQAR